VLIIGPDFAPSGLPPATRVRFFAKHLPEFGWRPLVLSVMPEFYDWPIDEENLSLLEDSLQVVRTEAWRTSWTRKLGVGDIGMRSFWQHWRMLKRLCRETKIDLIFIPVPPYVPMLLGRLAHKKFGIPYVIDYIDPWVTEYYWKLPPSERPPKWPFTYAMSRLFEPIAVKHVSHITGVSKGTTDSVVNRYQELGSEDASEIPYGAEAGDFEYLRRKPRANRIFDSSDGLFHMSSVGACIPSMHATVRALFGAVRLGLERDPHLFNRLRLHFVGTSYAPNGKASQDVRTLASEAGLESLVTEQTVRVPYLDSLQIMMDSDALFLLGSDEPHYTASKIFPYVLSRKPLLAIFHEESSVVQILKDIEAGETVVFNSHHSPNTKIDQILARLKTLLRSRDGFEPHTNWSAFNQYTTRAMTERLAVSFDKATMKALPPHLGAAVQNA